MAKLIIQRKQQQAQYFTEDLGDGVGLDMVLISGGTFWMGTEDTEAERLFEEYGEKLFRDETPQHKVNLSRFFIGRYPITQTQWRIVAGWEQVERKLDPDPSDFKEDYEGIDRWQRPVEQVSWDDAKEFCYRLSLKTKREYRLPTEAEWEYGCRSAIGGDMTVEEWNKQYNQPFHFGETISTDLANYDGNYAYGEGVKGEYREQTTPIGYFKVANNFGLGDMHGNVWEWCEDDWHDNYENAPNDSSVWQSQESSKKVIRGGSWYVNPHFCRSAIRNYNTREIRNNNFGFRVVCVAPRAT